MGGQFMRFLVPSVIVVLLTVSTYWTRAAHAVGANGHTLVFGAALSLTGSTEQEGHFLLNGYRLWVRQVNTHGGITVGKTRYRVALKYRDDGSDPIKSENLTRQLITTDKVNFLLGPYGSAATLPDSAIAEQHRIPMVEGGGASTSIFSRGFHYTFGVLSPAPQYADIMLQTALSLPNPPRSVGIIYASDAFSRDVAAAAHAFALSHGMKVTAYHEYPANATDLTGVLTPLKSAVPDMLLASGHANEAIVTMKECQRFGINPKLYAFTVGPATPGFVTSLGSDANDVISSAQWTAQQRYNGIDAFKTPANYQRIYRKAFGHNPPYQAAAATATGLAFQHALEKAGSIGPTKVRNALSRLRITTFFGPIRFDKTGSNTYRRMASIQIQHGAVVTVYPRKFANKQIIYPTPPFGSR